MANKNGTIPEMVKVNQKDFVNKTLRELSILQS